MPSAADLPPPTIHTIEAVRARIAGDEESFNEAIGAYLQAREDDGTETMLAVGALLGDAYSFAAFLVGLLTALEDGSDDGEADEFLDALILDKMAEMAS